MRVHVQSTLYVGIVRALWGVVIKHPVQYTHDKVSQRIQSKVWSQFCSESQRIRDETLTWAVYETEMALL